MRFPSQFITSQLTVTILALADDLTGALEAGALLQAPVSLRLQPSDVPGRLVIDTETRHLTAEAAARAIRAAVFRLSPSLIYKKTDSTLRGHIGAEIEALAQAFPDRPIHYIPAYPRMGRTVEGGCLFIHGVPVHQTAFALDARNPVNSSRIADFVKHLPQLQIYDASTDAEVADAVEICMQEGARAILCGPASVAGELARALGITTQQSPSMERGARVLVVNGSRHPTAKEQVGRLLPHPGWTILPFDCSGCHAEACVQRIASAVNQHLQEGSFDILIVIGGDTARGIVDAQGTAMLYPSGEIAPGVPVSRMGNLQLITKAGGFGPVDLLRNLQGTVTEETEA